MFCECPGCGIPIIEQLDFYTGKNSEIHTWHVGQWSREHQDMWNLRYTDSSVRRFSAWFIDLCRISYTTALVTIFLPLPGKTPSCPVLSNFTIIYLIARYNVGPLRCYFRRRTLTAVAAFLPLRKYSLTSYAFYRQYCNAHPIVARTTSYFYCAWHLYMLL